MFTKMFTALLRAGGKAWEQLLALVLQLVRLVAKESIQQRLLQLARLYLLGQAMQHAAPAMAASPTATWMGQWVTWWRALVAYFKLVVWWCSCTLTV
jgi:hypothetical protein